MFKNKAIWTLSLIACVALAGTARAGAEGGPKYKVTSVDAYSVDTYRIRFRGDEIAGIIVIGDGDTDLDLYVYDENGNLVASDSGYTDDCIVAFEPRWTGHFKVRIRNRGSVYNRYVMRTN